MLNRQTLCTGKKSRGSGFESPDSSALSYTQGTRYDAVGPTSHRQSVGPILADE